LTGQEKHGTVIAVCLSGTGGVPKYPQAAIDVAEGGVVGDYHYGKAGKDGAPRHVTIVAKEVLDSVSESLQIEVQAGDFAENFLVEGLGDLAAVQAGDRLRLGPEVVVRVTAQNAPCSNLAGLHSDIVRSLVGRRGLVAAVEAAGSVSAGDPASLVPAGGRREPDRTGPS